jgi:hypothetical protein
MNKTTSFPLKFGQIISETRLEMPEYFIYIFQQTGNKDENISCEIKKKM